MLSSRWYKVLGDLWGNKTRTLLVVLSIAVGVFAVGMIAGSQVVFSRELTASWEAVNPASATFDTEPFDEDLIWAVRRMPEVREADGRRSFGVRFKVGSDQRSESGEKDWRNLQLIAYRDYDDIRVFQVRPESGVWPPPDHEVLIERASLDWMGVQVGDVVLIEAPNGKERHLRVAGVAHDLTQMSSSWTGSAAGYITLDTLEWLGLPRNFDELHIIVAEKAYDMEHIRRVANQVQDKVEKSGRTVYYTWIPTPGRHPADEVIQPVLLLLGALGLLALLLSGFLVVNTIQALLTQQIRQIGIMKAIGARVHQIIGVYLSIVLVFGLLALVIAVPLGALGARATTSYMAGLLNFDVMSFGLPPRVLALEAAVGLIVPLLASLYPIISAVRVTAREAMSDYGLSNGHFGQGRLDWLLEHVRGLSRPLLLSLRNTFRRKGRLALTLTTLTLGGAIFIAVFSVRASLLRTLDGMYEYVRYDVVVSFRRAYRIEQIEREALRVDGVVTAESWRFSTARRQRPDGTESDNILIRAPRAETEMVYPTVAEGRWLLPEDENAVVINTQVLKDESDIKVGDEIVLKIEGRETTWRVVGLIRGTPPAPMAYVNYPYFARVVRDVGRAGVVIVATEQHDAASQSRIAKALEEHFESLGLRVYSTFTSTVERSQTESQFNVLVVFLLTMAILLAVVGGIGLMGTMSINVLERTREIGVMRAIGASDGAVLQIVIVEGILIGLLSWLIGGVLAFPLGKLLSDAVGISILQSSLSYTYSTGGAGLWLVAVVILAALASTLPARNASRLTVREVLAYE